MCTSEVHSNGTPVNDIQTLQIAQTIESNLADYWLSLGQNPAGSTFDNGSLRGASSGGPYFNRVVAAKLDGNEIDNQIRAVIRTFQNQGAAITWLTGPSTRPADLGDRLEHHGFNRYEPWSGMAHDLDRVDALPSLPDRLNIRQANLPEIQRDWSDVICRSFGLPHSASNLLPGSLASGSSRVGETHWTHNLAYRDGVPVAASTLFVSNGVAGIYLVATVPEARNQGLGTAMTSLAVRQARDVGCHLAVLHATAAGRRIYENLGFRHYCDIGVYRVPAPNPFWKRFASACLSRVRARSKRTVRQRVRSVMNQPSRDVRYAGDSCTADAHRPS